jgi:ABC-type Zn2+ transport system substrate-binding protein/surface adhesin
MKSKSSSTPLNRLSASAYPVFASLTAPVARDVRDDDNDDDDNDDDDNDDDDNDDDDNDDDGNDDDAPDPDWLRATTISVAFAITAVARAR